MSINRNKIMLEKCKSLFAREKAIKHIASLSTCVQSLEEANAAYLLSLEEATVAYMQQVAKIRTRDAA